MGFLSLYGITIATTLGLVTVLWLVSVAIRNASIIDIFWGAIFVVIAWVLLAANLDQIEAKMLAVTLLVTIWGLRLAFHLAMRNLGGGEDTRYVRWRLSGGPNWWLSSYYRIFLLQGGIAVVVATPLVAAFHRPEEFTFVSFLGLLVWAAGFAWEFAADLQLARFRAAAGPEEVMSKGLWRLCRHPNYFGDAVQWWGLGLFAFTVPTWWSLVGPLMMTVFFVYVSNDVIETGLRKRRPAYARYVEATSAFFPRPPRPVRDESL